jgi:hypothetical protein
VFIRVHPWFQLFFKGHHGLSGKLRIFWWVVVRYVVATRQNESRWRRSLDSKWNTHRVGIRRLCDRNVTKIVQLMLAVCRRSILNTPSCNHRKRLPFIPYKNAILA